MPIEPWIALLVVAGLLAVAVGSFLAQAARSRERSLRRAGLPEVTLPAPGRHSPLTKYILALAVLIAGMLVMMMGNQSAPPTPPANGAAGAAPDAPPPTPSTGGTSSARTPAAAALAPATPARPLGEQEWCARGDAMLAASEYGMAEQAYQEALRLNPRSKQARSGAARAQRAAQAQQAREEASSRAEEVWGAEGTPPAAPSPGYGTSPPRVAFPTDPHTASGPQGWDTREDARYHRTQGDALMARGLPSLAAREYEKALQSNPSDSETMRHLQEARQRALRPTRAPSPYRR